MSSCTQDVSHLLIVTPSHLPFCYQIRTYASKVLLMFIGGRCITRGRFWGGKGLESEKGVLEENELLGVNIIGVFLPEELLGLTRLSIFLSILLKEIITVPSVFWAMKSGSVFSSLVWEKWLIVAIVQEDLCLSIVSVGVHEVYYLGLRLEEGICPLGDGSTMDWGSRVVFISI